MGWSLTLHLQFLPHLLSIVLRHRHRSLPLSPFNPHPTSPPERRTWAILPLFDPTSSPSVPRTATNRSTSNLQIAWGEETLAATMRPFTLDHALSSPAVQFRRSEFLTYILETKVPGLHFNVDDEEKLPKSTMAPHMLTAGRPRIVDDAREAHMIAGHLQNGEGWDSDNAVMKILGEQGSKGDPSSGTEEDQKFTGDEPGDVVSDGISHSQCLEFLCNQGPHFLMKNLKDKETICSVLLDMAGNVKVLPPGNEPLPWDVLNMTLWRASLCELMKEMKTVEEKCPSLMGTSGVYVLTTSPYSAFLRALAAEIADAAEKIQVDN